MSKQRTLRTGLSAGSKGHKHSVTRNTSKFSNTVANTVDVLLVTRIARLLKRSYPEGRQYSLSLLRIHSDLTMTVGSDRRRFASSPRAYSKYYSGEKDVLIDKGSQQCL